MVLIIFEWKDYSLKKIYFALEKSNDDFYLECKFRNVNFGPKFTV